MICLMSLLFPYLVFKIELLEPSSHHKWCESAILHLWEYLRSIRYFYTHPLDCISHFQDFTHCPNSSRARECNCLYSASHTSEQGKKFPPFLKFISCLYLVGCTHAHLTCCTCVSHLLTWIFSTYLHLETKNSITLFQPETG